MKSELKFRKNCSPLFKKNVQILMNSNIVSNEAVGQPPEDANSNEGDEETNLIATTREQINRYVEKGASLENDIIQHESLASKNDNASSQTLFQ